MIHFILVLVAILCARPVPVAAQISADSMTQLTRTLVSGSLLQRAQATWTLQQQHFQSISPAARVAILAEFARINELLRAGLPIPGEEALVGEDFGEYYSALSEMVFKMEGREAQRALARSAGGGIGLLQRTAEAGEEIIPLLVERVRDDFGTGDALETMGYAWFWADSTGAVLADNSRKVILEHISAALRQIPVTPHAGTAAENTKDPIFLELARAAAADPRNSEHNYFLERYSIPALVTRSASLTPLQLSSRGERALALVCLGEPGGLKRGACESLQNQLATATSHLKAGRREPARAVLDAFLRNAGVAQRNGAFTEAEHLLITGAASLLLSRRF